MVGTFLREDQFLSTGLGHSEMVRFCDYLSLKQKLECYNYSYLMKEEQGPRAKKGLGRVGLIYVGEQC